jgi:cytochrome c oxidase cbb3-type subunit 3
LFIIIGAAAAGIACQIQPAETAVAGALPAVATPIGPIPGPAMQRAGKVNPYAQDRVALAEGRKLFVQYNCSGCHGGHAGGGMGPSLRDQVWIYGGDDAHVASSIAQGRAHGMPAWGTQLPEQQIWKLAAYIKSMRTSIEPDPPEQK